MFYRKLYSNLTRTCAFNKNNTNILRSIVTNFKENVHRTDLISDTVESSQIKTVKDWSNVRKGILEHELNRGQYTNNNVDAMILGHCSKIKQYELGALYLTFLHEERLKINLATLGKYLKLLYYKNHEKCLATGKPCDENDEKIILKYCEDIRKDYPVLDSFTLENIILALSVTTRWKDCFDLLENVKITATPSTLVYSAISTSAFLYDEQHLGWSLLKEMLEQEKIPFSNTFIAYIKSTAKFKTKKEIVGNLEKLFVFFQENDLKCGADVVASILELGKQLHWKGNLTNVTFKGICKNCSENLDRFELTDGEFGELKAKVMENVIVGRDIFVKTNPDELENFKKFVDNIEQFDVVLDGLNIAYSAGAKQSPYVLSSLVASVVSHFVEQGKRVLVLGRVHMKRWPQSSWFYIKNNASIFLTQNISQDDPYLLYCALNSGKNTIIVTKDLMRGHKFLLKDPRLKMLFNRWLTQRQYQLIRVDAKKGPTFKVPLPFSVTAQCNRGAWHIPYEPSAQNYKSLNQRNWLCLKK